MIEKELIEECKEGNLKKFRELVKKTSPMIFPACFRILGDEDTAQDVVQETMITVWQKLRMIRSAATYKTWVYRIAVNKCYDILRLRRRNPESRFGDKEWAVISNHISEDADIELEKSEYIKIVEVMTNSLSPKQKMVFILSELEELSNDEISTITGMYRSTVKANLYYARKKITDMLKKYPQV